MVKAEPFESLVSGDARLQELGLQAGDRTASARTIEEVGKAKPELLPLLLKPLQPLLGDESPAVVKRAMQTLTSLYRPALALIAQQQGPVPPELLEMWELLGELKAHMLSSLEMSASDAVRTNALKFAVSLVLAFCSQEGADGAAPAAWSVAQLVAGHALLKAEALREEGDALLQQLLLLLRQSLSSTVLMVLMNALGDLGKQRPPLLPLVVPGLCELQRRVSAGAVEGLQRAQLGNVQTSLKSSLLALVKLPAVKAASLAAVEASLLVSLHALGAAAQAELHLRQQGREMPSAEQLAATAAPLMQQSMAAAAPSGGKRAAAEPLELDSKRQRAGESASDASGAGSGGGSHGSSMHLDKNAGASMPLTRLPAAQIAQLQQMLSMLAPEMVAELVISSMSHLPPRPAPPPPPGAAAAAAAAALPEPLGEEECGALSAAVLRRLLLPAREAQLGAAGGAELRRDLLGRLAASQPVGSPFHQQLRDHICGDEAERREYAAAHAKWEDACRAAAAAVPQRPRPELDPSSPPRLELALSWLYAEHAADGSGRQQRYGAVAAPLMEAVRAALPPTDREWTRLLIEAPALPGATVALLAADCRVPERQGLALSSLREIALRRDAQSAACVRVLLGGAVDSADVKLRTASIQLLGTDFYPRPRFAAAVGAHAREQLGLALQAESDEQVTPRLLLFLSLAAKTAPLLGALLGGFGGATAAAQAKLLAYARGLLQAMPFEARGAPLLEQVSGAAAAAEPLVLRLLLAAAEERAPAEEGAGVALSEKQRKDLESYRHARRELSSGVLALAGDAARRARLVAPLLPSLSAEQARQALPLLLRLPPAETKLALVRLMHAAPPPLLPAQLLLELHLLDLEDKGLIADVSPEKPVRLLIQAVQTCIAERSVFTQEVMAATLQLLVAQEPLPKLTVRTIMQSLTLWPRSVEFVMNIIQRLLAKQVWSTPPLWQGVVKCLHQAMPVSFPVLLQLPRPQLLDALEQQPDFREKLVAYAATNLDTVPQDALEVLGLDEEEELLVPTQA